MADIEQNIGYTFRDKALLRRALTHSSRNKKYSNERLEFLGDSVLSLITSRHLFFALPECDEGRLTRLRAELVCEKSLAGFAREIGLGKFVALGAGEEKTNARERPSLLSDAFEAVLAAVYTDGGMNAAETFMARFLPSADTLKSMGLSDFKTALQEKLQVDPNVQIVYNTDCAGDEFSATVSVNGKMCGSGKGGNKKNAEQNAAKEALAYFDKSADT